MRAISERVSAQPRWKQSKKLGQDSTQMRAISERGSAPSRGHARGRRGWEPAPRAGEYPRQDSNLRPSA